MSRTLPRATGVRPAKWVSRTTRLAGLADTEIFSLDKVGSILAQREGKSKAGTVEPVKNILANRSRTNPCGSFTKAPIKAFKLQRRQPDVSVKARLRLPSGH